MDVDQREKQRKRDRPTSVIAPGQAVASIEAKIGTIVLQRPLDASWLLGFSTVVLLTLLLLYVVSWLLIKGIGIWVANTPFAWDFANKGLSVVIVPSWHSMNLPPYFVASVILSSFAMVLTLAIPLCKFYHNVLIPQTLRLQKVRTNLVWLFLLSLIVQLGMWIECVVIIEQSLRRDDKPFAWQMYYTTLWDRAALLGTVGLFCILFFLLVRLLPLISIHERQELFYKTDSLKPKPLGEQPRRTDTEL